MVSKQCRVFFFSFIIPSLSFHFFKKPYFFISPMERVALLFFSKNRWLFKPLLAVAIMTPRGPTFLQYVGSEPWKRKTNNCFGNCLLWPTRSSARIYIFQRPKFLEHTRYIDCCGSQERARCVLRYFRPGSARLR